jgi:hypothetical protein
MTSNSNNSNNNNIKILYSLEYIENIIRYTN